MFVLANATWIDFSESAALGPGGRDSPGIASDGSWLFVHGGETLNGILSLKGHCSLALLFCNITKKDPELKNILKHFAFFLLEKYPRKNLNWSNIRQI